MSSIVATMRGKGDAKGGRVLAVFPPHSSFPIACLPINDVTVFLPVSSPCPGRHGTCHHASPIVPRSGYW